MVSSYNFFADLPVLAADGALCSLADYSVVPRDWYIAVADVRGSTRAIEEGLIRMLIWSHPRRLLPF